MARSRNSHTHTILCRLLSGNCKQRSNDEFGQNDYTLAATAAAASGGVRRLPGSPGRRGNSTQLSSARFAICVYASFVVALFAYRFGVFRLAEHAAVRPGFDLVRFRFGFGWVRFGLVCFFATATATATATACLAACRKYLHPTDTLGFILFAAQTIA